jgi:hypothetical protein
MTSAQLAWKQFTAAHIQREGGEAHEHRDLPDNREEGIDLPAPSKNSRTSTSTSKTTTSTKSKRIQFSTTGHLINTNNRTAATAATAVAISPAAPAAGFEQVKKAKTRAERRAEEPEVEPEETEEPVAPKERRSDYWVQRDDLRRNNARMMKVQFQEFQE